MKNAFRILMIVLALSTTAQAAEWNMGPKLDKGLYIGSGVLGTIVGFGTGHILQNRWEQMGWIFTAGEAASFALMITSWIIGPGSGRDIVGIIGYIGFAGFKVWEIVDIWGEPVWDHRLEGSSKYGYMGSPAGSPALAGAMVNFGYHW